MERLARSGSELEAMEGDVETLYNNSHCVAAINRQALVIAFAPLY